MRRRRSWILPIFFLPIVFARYDPGPAGYEANPIGRFSPDVPERPYLPPRAPIARGYQPPPQPALFEPPRSYYTVQHHQKGHGHMPAVANPLPKPPTNWASPRPIDLEAEQQLLFEAEKRLMMMRHQPKINEDEFLIKAIGTKAPTKAPGAPVRQPEPPHRFVFTPQNIGPPASSPSRVKTPRQHQVQPASIPSLEENPPDIENNIIVHIYLNSKGHPPAHAVSKIGPIHGVFGIGTAHGGPGTHQNPIVIVKEFDRDKLKFVDENTANKMMEEGPANIVEVKAMVSTPDKKIETTLNKAVNTELDRAIPVVLNRFHGSTSDMAGDLSLRKELEQALVDEIAKNLGETIDTMSEVTEEDIDKLIEQELETELEEKPTTVAPATKRITIATMTTMAETKTTTQRLVTTRILPSETTRKTTKTTQIPTTARRETITLPRTTQGTRLIQKITTEATPTPSITAKRPSSPSITTRRTTTTTQTTKASPTTRSTESTTGTTHTVTKKISTSSRPPLPSITTVPWLPPTFRVTTEPRTTKERIITITKVPTTITERPTTTTKKYTERARETVTLRPTATTVRSQPTEVPPAKIPINFNEENIIETRPGVQIATAIPTSPSTVIPIHSWTYSSSQPDDDFNIVTSRPIKIVDISSESKEVTGFFAPEATVNVPIDIETATVALTSETTLIHQEHVFEPTVSRRPGVVHLISEEEEKKSEGAQGKTKPTPSSFGKMNMMGEGEEENLEGMEERPEGERITNLPTATQSGDLWRTTSLSSTKGITERPQDTTRVLEMSQKTIERVQSITESISGGSWTTPPVPIVPWSPPETFRSSNELSKNLSIIQSSSQGPSETSKTTMQPKIIGISKLSFSTSIPTPEPFLTHDVFVTSTIIPPWMAMPTETEEITQGECSIPNDPSERAKADVLFLLDSSNKFTEDKFMHAITLILNTVEKLRNIGSDGVQVSLVQFNTEPYLEFSLRKHNCKQFLKDDIADTQYMTGGSMLGRALEKVMKFAFTKKRGDRPDVPNILIILTDGQSEDRVQLPIQLTRRDHNVTVYVIGTLEANPEYLKSLSGSSDNVFQLSSSENVPLASQLAERIKNERIEIRDDENDEKEEVETGQRQPVVNLNDDGDDSIPPFPPTKTGIVHLECSGEGFKIQFNLPSRFEGHVVVKGREKDSKCQMPIISSHQPGNKTFSFFIPADECGVTTVESQDPQGRNTSVIVHLVHAPSLRTEEDRAFLLQCFIGSKLHEEEVSTQLNVIRSDVTIAETISLSSLPPSCTYSIRKDRPDGAIISRATVGQAVYHRWDCDGDEKASNVYGIKIHSCFASDDVEQKYPIIDSQGCSSDLALLTNPVYDEEKMSAYALSHVFGVLDHDSLKFICKLSLCTRDGDGCEGITPPRCNDNHTDLLVWKPAISQTDSALTSALSTKVDIGVEPLYTRVIGAVLDSKIFLAISGLMLFAAATLLVVHKLRQQQDAVLTSSSSSSYRSRASSHFETSSSEESQTSGQPVDPRLHEFLKTFDRSRYV